MQENEDRCQCRIVHKERVNNARRHARDAEVIEAVAQFFKTLADPTRLRMVLALEEAEMCVCDLAAFLGVSESAVSHQLRILRQVQMVASRRQGPVLYYRLVDDHVRRVTGLALAHMTE
jgi:ArsR family transcriptional regulator, lead/cadmium/zinc/bismuth-responsive transcriptional repressor